MPVLDGWWYVAGDSNVGPLSEHTLRRRIDEGAVEDDTPMWRAGMPDWLPLNQIPELVALRVEVLAASPPATMAFEPIEPLAIDVLPGMVGPAGAWSRLWARMLDQLVAIVAIDLVLKAVAYLIPGFGFWAFPSGLLLWLSPVPVLLDASLMVWAGGTLGKYLLGIRVRRADGAKLGLREAWKRALRLWLFGYAGGIPVVNLVFQIMAYVALRGGKPVCWDRESGDVVIQFGRHRVGRILAALVMIVIFGLAHDAIANRLKAPMITWLHTIQQELNKDMDETGSTL